MAKKFQWTIEVECRKCRRVVKADWDGGNTIRVHRHGNRKEGGWCKAETIKLGAAEMASGEC